MRVAFSAEVLADESAWSHLDQILYEIVRGVHEWHVDDPEAVEGSAWLLNGRPSLRTLFEKAAMQTSPREQRRLHRLLLTVGADAPPTSLPPAKAVLFLRTPLKVLMENRLTDGIFLDAILSVLAHPEVVRFKEELKAIVYDSPGGNGELKKLVKEAHAEARRERLPLRVVVFTDSDGPRKGKKSRDAAAVEEVCGELGIPCVVLCKRSIENYVPDEVIHEWRSEPEQTSARPRIDALLRVGVDNVERRDHLHMKNGLRKLSADEAELFTSEPPLPPEDRVLLEERGFDDEFIHILFVKEASGEFKRAPNGAKKPRPSLTAEALRKRDGRVNWTSL